MKTPLANYTQNRDNNFNLIRFIAACLVLFTHSFALSLGSGEFEPMRLSLGMTWGDIAVDVFFISSGFLITSSYFARNNLLAFVWARLLRIFPALVVAVSFCVLVIGLLFTTYQPLEFLTSNQTVKFFLKNSILLFDVEYYLPGVFLNTPYPEAINGSLWTLPIELKMYGLLALVLIATGILGKYNKNASAKNMVLLIAVDSVFLHMIDHFHPLPYAPLIHLTSMFFVGATFWLWRDKLVLSNKWIMLTLPVLIGLSLNKDLFFIAYCIGLPFIIFYLAYVPKGKIRLFNQFGDYSYGIYIYAFPVQQALAALVPNISVPMMILASFIITFALAMLSWHFIEKPALAFKSAYVHLERFGQKRLRYLVGN